MNSESEYGIHRSAGTREISRLRTVVNERQEPREDQGRRRKRRRRAAGANEQAVEVELSQPEAVEPGSEEPSQPEDGDRDRADGGHVDCVV